MSLLKRLASRTLLRSRGRFVGSVSACFAAGLKRQRRQLQPTIRFAAVAAATHCPQAGTMSPRCSMASNASCSQRSFATSSEAPGDAVEGETTVSSKTFHCVADATLDLFTEHLEELEEPFEDLELEFSDGVLSINFGSHGFGSWVLNKQGPNRQIWWSSPVSGPKRFYFNADTVTGLDDLSQQEARLAELIDEGKEVEVACGWLNTRDGQPLVELLKTEMQAIHSDFSL